MVTPPPRPPFMKSLFIFFSDHFLNEKKDDFEGCLKGVDGCFKGVEGCCRVFEVCLEGVWKNKIEVWNQFFLENKVVINFDFRSGAKKSGHLDYPFKSYGPKFVSILVGFRKI